MKLFLILALVALGVQGMVIRDAKSDLIAKANDLVKKADEAVTKLEADKKTHEATIIKTEEARIKKLIEDLTAATDDAKVKTLEHELTMADNRLAHELARVNHTGPVVVNPPTNPANPAKRDAKSDLITKANDLVKKADEAIVKLEADKKTHEVTVIKAEETRIKKLVEDLTAATEAAQITRLEHELQALDARLAHELNRINHTGPVVNPPTNPANPSNPAKRDAKSDLITKANDLVKKADEAIVKLEADKKTHEVTVIKAEETRIKKLVEDLTAATEAAQITRLEHELQALDARLAHELNRINHTGPVVNPPTNPANPSNPAKRDAKSDLITKANDLVKKADEAIVKLEADKKTHEVTVIKAEETRIKKLVEDLTAATEAAQITRLEHELQALDARLAHELNRINHTGPVVNPPTNPANPSNPAKRDAKSDLITKANDLLKKADEAVTKLEADKKTHEATIIKTEEARIKKLVEDLTAATDDAKVKTLEHELTMADNRLAHELARVNHTGPVVVNPPTNPANPAKRDAKSDLITKANDLLKKADEAVTKLEADKKTHEATIIKTEEAKIKKLVEDLTAATDDAKVKTLERELTMADNRLAHELLRVNHTGPVVVNPPANPTNP